ncbi:MAG TPA: transglycosylase family protein [Solirubrobacterales bacterium]
MLTKRTYSKRIYLAPLLLIALTLPAVALAAPGDGGGSSQRIGLANAKPVEIAALTGPAESFHRAIRVTVHRIRVERRARLRREHREAFATLPGGVSQATLDSIGACESAGDPTAVSSDGSYRGKYQFDYGTWESVGGSGDPAAAPEQEQDYRAALLYAQSGSSPWPVCG